MTKTSLLALVALAVSACSGAAAKSPDAGAGNVCPLQDAGLLKAADLPSGVCGGSPSCAYHTEDPCPDGTQGPGILWDCTCPDGGWSCADVAHSRNGCASDAG